MGHINLVNQAFILEQVCETNYRKLFRLIPDLMTYEQGAIGYSRHRPNLRVMVIERAPYTMTLELSHCFDEIHDELFEPAVKIRIYLDAKLAEVIRDHARSHVSSVIKDPGQFKEIMEYKWSLNYFLEKWLDHCLKTNYQFENKDLALADV